MDWERRWVGAERGKAAKSQKQIDTTVVSHSHHVLHTCMLLVWCKGLNHPMRVRVLDYTNGVVLQDPNGGRLDGQLGAARTSCSSRFR